MEDLDILETYNNMIYEEHVILENSVNFNYILYKQLQFMIKVIKVYYLPQDSTLKSIIDKSTKNLKKLSKLLKQKPISHKDNLVQKLKKRFKDHNIKSIILPDIEERNPNKKTSISSNNGGQKINYIWFHNDTEDDFLDMNIQFDDPKPDSIKDEFFIKNYPHNVDSNSSVLFGVIKNTPVCYVKLEWKSQHECFIDSVVVLDKYKGMGLCKKIMNQITNYLYHNKNIQKIGMHVLVNEENKGHSLLCYMKSLKKYFPLYQSEKLQDLDLIDNNSLGRKLCINCFFPKVLPEIPEELLDDENLIDSEDGNMYEILQEYYYFYSLDFFKMSY